jgi:metal-responsive CopG/Arc/MetJ family transcriptional regulator
MAIPPVVRTGYTISVMKTAISVDDQLLSDADRAAREMGLSRSRLIATALEAYLRRRRQEETTARLNEVFAEDDPAEARTLKLMKAKFRSSIKESW